MPVLAAKGALDTSRRQRPANPEGWQKVAGGRRPAATPGCGRPWPCTPAGCQKSTRSRRAPSGIPPGCNPLPSRHRGSRYASTPGYLLASLRDEKCASEIPNAHQIRFIRAPDDVGNDKDRGPRLPSARRYATQALRWRLRVGSPAGTRGRHAMNVPQLSLQTRTFRKNRKTGLSRLAPFPVINSPSNTCCCIVLLD